ncbi:MAG: hypothetical protein HY207_01070 [Nitrospirae bacterium]|nr:hypothetical protein [Nitrospirota bacterium]
MSDLFKIVLTSSLTVLGGVIVFSLGQLIQKFLIDPVHEQAKVIGAISFGLTYYACWYANPGSGKPDDLSGASDAIRRYASELTSSTNSVRCYGLFHKLGLVPDRSAVGDARTLLILISNSIFQSNASRDNSKDAKEVKRLLKIPDEPVSA